jgi:hypothetical protein
MKKIAIAVFVSTIAIVSCIIASVFFSRAYHFSGGENRVLVVANMLLAFGLAAVIGVQSDKNIK